MRYHVTFGQQYPRKIHPRFSAAHRDGFVDVIADDRTEARAIAIAYLGNYWSNLYDDDDEWDRETFKHFPLGCLATFPVR